MSLGELAGRIRTLRRHRGMNQMQLAGKLGVSRSALANWESAAAWPTLEHILQLAQTLDASSDWLVLGRGTAPFEVASAGILVTDPDMLEFVRRFERMTRHQQKLLLRLIATAAELDRSLS